jgi:hypothetical protein
MLVGHKPEFQDTITGGVYDDTGLAFVAFFRVSNPQGLYSSNEVMAQTPYGEIFVIEHAIQEGVFRKSFKVTLANSSRSITVKIRDSVEAFQDSLVKSFIAANSAHVAEARRDGAKDVSPSFWFPLAEADMRTTLTFIAKGPFSKLVKPPHS